jgi:hypothetical protein
MSRYTHRESAPCLELARYTHRESAPCLQLALTLWRRETSVALSEVDSRPLGLTRSLVAMPTEPSRLRNLYK